jgi:dolichol-phosphate mannosyltransferase
MLQALENADVVLGSRYVSGISVVGWDFRRLLISKFATWYVRTITGIRLSDATSGYRCWRTSALGQLGLAELSAQGYLILVEMAYWAFRKNFRIAEVPIIFYERRFGASKIDPAVIRESALGVLALRWRFAKRKARDTAAKTAEA